MRIGGERSLGQQSDRLGYGRLGDTTVRGVCGSVRREHLSQREEYAEPSETQPSTAEPLVGKRMGQERRRDKKRPHTYS